MCDIGIAASESLDHLGLGIHCYVCKTELILHVAKEAFKSVIFLNSPRLFSLRLISLLFLHQPTSDRKWNVSGSGNSID